MGRRAGGERRASKRVTVAQDLFFGSPKGHRLVDLSEDGMFLETKRPYMIGSTIDLRFRLSDDRPEVEVQGKVIYVLEGLGMGLQFVEISLADREQIRDFVTQN
jgi:Tfp pilus assembly protein PilZ